LKWSATQNVRWKTELPEPGNSSPIVWGDKVFLTQPVGARRTLMCVNRNDGKVLWQSGAEYPENDPTHRNKSIRFGHSRVGWRAGVAWFGSAGIYAYDFAGKELWKCDLGKQTHEWGYGSSPILYGDLCLLNFGPGKRSFLIALDKKTGKTLGRWTRRKLIRRSASMGSPESRDNRWVRSAHRLIVKTPRAMNSC
jgi:outer membrane protein assembly factor BamB